MLSSIFVVLSVTAAAMANVFITSPVASTTFNGGQQATVTWQDDGAAPSLAQFGTASISIYAGNAQQQTLLQTISPSTDMSTTSSVVFTPDPTIGPNSNEYFIRVQSAALLNGQYPAEAFSAKFTMASMTGTFNSSVQAEIDGQSTAPIGGSTTAAAPTNGASSTAMVTLTSKVASSTAASSSTAKATTSATSGARGMVASSVTALMGCAAVGAALW